MKGLIICLIVGFLCLAVNSFFSEERELYRINQEMVSACTYAMESNPDFICE